MESLRFMIAKNGSYCCSWSWCNLQQYYEIDYG